MRKWAKAFFRALVLVLGTSAAAHADPITFTISGQISYLGGGWEDFTGTFVLSDASTSLYGPDDSRGTQRDWYTIEALTLSSANHTLTGTGSMVAWWGFDGAFNAIDSMLSFYTSGGLFETPVFSCCAVAGSAGSQPMQISSGHLGASGNPFRMNNFSAMRSVGVPEPSTLLLSGLGLAGLAAFRRRIRQA